MKCYDTPPRHELSDEEIDMDDVDEVIELENDDDLLALEEELMNEPEEGPEMQDDELEDNEEGPVKAADLVYSNHKDSVFCVAFSPKDNLVATGGEDDTAFVWDSQTGETKLECIGHEDSVTSVSFSHDGSFLAVGNLKGLVQAWRVSTFTKEWEFDTGDDLNFMLWHPVSNVLFAGTCGGDIWMWLIPQGQSKSLSHTGISAECGTIMKDGKRIGVGFKDGSVKVIDLKQSQVLQTFQCHSEQVTSICSNDDDLLIASGSIDGTAVVSNTISGKEVVKFNCAFGTAEENKMEEDYNNTVEVVSFCPQLPSLLITATLSGVIIIWDIPSKTSRHQIVQQCATSSLSWHLHDPIFFAAGIDGKLRAYDARSGEQKIKYIGHNDSILSCDINKENTHIVTCGDDHTARIFSLEDFVS